MPSPKGCPQIHLRFPYSFGIFGPAAQSGSRCCRCYFAMKEFFTGNFNFAFANPQIPSFSKFNTPSNFVIGPLAELFPG